MDFDQNLVIFWPFGHFLIFNLVYKCNFLHVDAKYYSYKNWPRKLKFDQNDPDVPKKLLKGNWNLHIFSHSKLPIFTNLPQNHLKMTKNVQIYLFFPLVTSFSTYIRAGVYILTFLWCFSPGLICTFTYFIPGKYLKSQKIGWKLEK